MSVVKLRIEIERALRDLAAKRRIVIERSAGILHMLRALQGEGPMPASTEEMLGALRTMNEVSRGIDVDVEAAKTTVEVGTMFLAELKGLQDD